MWTADLPAGPGRVVRVLATDRAQGDLSVAGDPDVLASRRRRVLDRPWVWLRQVHGAEVVVVGPDDDPAAVSGASADAAVTARDDVALAVHVADCAPVALVGRRSEAAGAPVVVGAAHAGWKGLEAGVLAETVRAMRDLGAVQVVATVGPCIGAECYEFGAGDLDRLAARFGPAVRSETADGRPALDLRAGVGAALAEAGVELLPGDPRCTACAGGAGPELFSHRARHDTGRQALLVWQEERR